MKLRGAADGQRLSARDLSEAISGRRPDEIVTGAAETVTKPRCQVGMRAFLLVVVLGSVAHAELRGGVRWGDYTESRAPRALIRLLGVDDGKVDHVSLAVADEPRGVHATLRFELATKLRDAQTLQLPLELTHGTLVTGMTYSLGGELAIEAFTYDADEARTYFERIVARRKDPALLRMVQHTDRRDLLQLAVFPVTRGVPATVTIEMLLPAAEQLVFDPGVTAPRTLKLPEHGDRNLTKLEYVTMTTSLVAGDEAIHAASVRPGQRAQVLPRVVTSSDRRYELRTLIREHATQLSHCYEYGVIRDPQLSPSALLAVDVAANGRITRAEVSGELAAADVRACIADEVRSWKFSAADHPREVRQAIDALHLD